MCCVPSICLHLSYSFPSDKSNIHDRQVSDHIVMQVAFEFEKFLD